MYLNTDFIDGPLLRADLLFLALPRNTAFSYQRIVGLAYGSTADLSLHNWKFALDIPSDERLTIHSGTSPEGKTITPANPVTGTSLGGWCVVDGVLGLIPVSGDCRELFLDIPEQRNDPEMAVRYITINAAKENPSVNYQPGEVIKQGAILIQTGGGLDEIDRLSKQNQGLESEIDGWRIWSLTTSEKEKLKIAFRTGRKRGQIPDELRGLEVIGASGMAESDNSLYEPMGWCILKGRK
ncbi:hypothetical protein ACFLT7_06190 [candidate division KSB1 bacterium]